MTDIPVHLDPFATASELANPPRTVIFADGEPTDFRPSKPSTASMDALIAQAEQWGAESVGFFGDRRSSWERPLKATPPADRVKGTR